MLMSGRVPRTPGQDGPPSVDHEFHCNGRRRFAKHERSRRAADLYPDRMERRDLRFRSYDDVLADAGAVLLSGYGRAGNWSLGQVCHHLAAVMEMSLDGFPSRFPW